MEARGLALRHAGGSGDVDALDAAGLGDSTVAAAGLGSAPRCSAETGRGAVSAVSVGWGGRGWGRGSLARQRLHTALMRSSLRGTYCSAA